MVLAQGSNKVDLLVYPMGSTDNNTPLDAHKALNRPADITNVARATWSARAVTATEETGRSYRKPTHRDCSTWFYR